MLGIQLKDSGLLVENDLHDFMSPTPYKVNDAITLVKGPLHYSFGNFKILPTSKSDVK